MISLERYDSHNHENTHGKDVNGLFSSCKVRSLTRTLNYEEKLVDSEVTVWVIRQFSFFHPTVFERCFYERAYARSKNRLCLIMTTARKQVYKNFSNVYYQDFMTFDKHIR